jgi:hypothetical protein
MAIYVTKTASIGIGGVDLSSYVKQITFDMGTEAVDLSAMGNTTRIFGAGLRTVNVSVDFLQDFASAKVDATLGAAVLAGTLVQVNIMAAGTTASATNPRYWFQGYIESYTAVAGNVGEAGTAKVTIKPAANFDAANRATSGAITINNGT